MKCSFCGYEIERGTGKIKFMKDERVVNLCGTKCEKNMFKLGRIPRETAWTADYKAAKTMRMATEQHKDHNHGKEAKVSEKKEVKKESKTQSRQSRAVHSSAVEPQAK